MKTLLIIFAGGGMGSIVRYYLGQWITLVYPGSFPIGTLIVNVLACLVLGVATAFADQKLLLGTSSKLFWTVGFCGGFSTFSTFSNESLTLLNSGFQLTMLLYVLLSVVLCLGAVWTGLYLGKLI